MADFRNDCFQIALTKHQRGKTLTLAERIDLSTFAVIGACKGLQLISDGLKEGCVTKNSIKHLIVANIKCVEKEILRLKKEE